MSPRSPIDSLQQVDWNFADYSSSQFPGDINSIHWYPAGFVPQIPAILIKYLSKEGDVVLDPFAGSGTTIIEASRLGRCFIGVDRNPYAVNICRAKLAAIAGPDTKWFENEVSKVQSMDLVEDAADYCENAGIDKEVFKWFETSTLTEILTLHRHILRHRGTHANSIRGSALSSILNRCCSQRDHYTYITDRCFPKKFIARPAREMYCGQIKLISHAVQETRRQFRRLNNHDWNPADDGVIYCHDARNLGWLNDGSVDFVVTSPPYLGVNDYVRSMRLTELLLPEEGGDAAIADEIGARRKRQRPTAFDDYRQDMAKVFAEISRILKNRGYLALVLGQGRGRVNKGDVIEMLTAILTDDHGFSVLFKEERRIKFRRIQVPGVGTERIIVLRR